jgi:hypothetical protein
MTLKHLLAGAAVAAFMIVGTAAKADVVIGSEDPASGFVGDLFQGQFSDSVTVASDGEAAFDPFGAGFDTSDGIDFTHQINANLWVQDAGSVWTQLPTGAPTWVLPASTPCGSENEPSCEPVGHWTAANVFWVPNALGTRFILEGPNGGISDRIVTYNDAAGAHVAFYSDPIGIPEPATWAMMLTGFFGLGAMVRSRKTVVA